jgi:MSHA biogenesis protein MshG
VATRFRYIAVSPEGKRISGVMEAENADIAKNMIDAGGFIPVSVLKISSNLRKFSLRALLPVNRENLIVLTRKLYTLSHAGIPLLRTFDIIIEDTSDKNLNAALINIRKSIEGGSSLADAFSKQEGFFPSIYVEALKAGEESGTLDVMLARTIELLERDAKIMDGIKTAIRYPAYVLVTMALALIVILTFVIPKFAGMYSAYGAELPWATKVILGLNEFARSYWWSFFVIIPLVVAGSLYLRLTNWGKKQYDLVAVSAPVFGNVYIKAVLARFCYTLSTLLSAGLPLSRALAILKDSIGNFHFSKVISKMGENLSGGRNLLEPMKDSKYFSPLVVQMFAIGLESGSLENLLINTATHFDAEVEKDTRKLTSRVEPILTIAVAVMVLILALAILTPMWNLIEIFKR